MTNDPLGVKPIGESTKIIVEKTFQGIEGFLAATCKPVLDELGMMFRDKVRVWRLNNALNVIEKTKGKFEYKDGDIHLSANPKVALAVIENGSNEENDELQDMWAGLFATSYSEDGKDEENILYVSILKNLTLPAAKLVKHICENSKKTLYDHDIVGAQMVSPKGDELQNITGIKDLNKIEVILHKLNSLRLTHNPQGQDPSGFHSKNFNGQPLAWLRPTNLALNFYLRCIGYKGTAKEYWHIKK